MIIEHDVVLYSALIFLCSFLLAVHQISDYIKLNKELNDKLDDFDRIISAASYTIIKLEMEKKKLLKQLSQNCSGRGG